LLYDTIRQFVPPQKVLMMDVEEKGFVVAPNQKIKLKGRYRRREGWVMVCIIYGQGQKAKLGKATFFGRPQTRERHVTRSEGDQSCWIEHNYDDRSRSRALC
jgi:hypothetical protein